MSMFAFHTSRSDARKWSAEFPIGDPYGGPANGKREDVGSVVGAVAGPIIGGIFGEESANTQAAAATQAAGISGDAVKYAADVQKQIYDQARADQQPWRYAGANALAQMVSGTQPGGAYAKPTPFSFTATDFSNNQDPGYSFRLNEGLKALDRSAAARGGLLSGAALKGISRYGQDLASQEFGNAYNRALTSYNSNLNATNTGFNRLAALAGIGQTANNQIQQAGSTYGSNVGNLAMTGATNAGNAALAAGNARASAYQGVGNALGRINFGNVFGNNGAYDAGYGDVMPNVGSSGSYGGYDW